MKRIIAVFAFALSSLASQAQARHIILMLAGDSITYAGPSNNLSPGFRCPLYSRLVTDGVDFEYTGDVNAADCGVGGTSGLHSGWPGYKIEDLNAILTPSTNGGNAGSQITTLPNVVALQIGTNDALGGSSSIVSNIMSIGRLLAILQNMSQQYPGVSFIVSKIPPLCDGTATNGAGYSGYSTRALWWQNHEGVAVSMAQQLGLDVTFIDPGLTCADISGDGVHPAVWTKLTNAYATAVEAVAARTPPSRPNPR